MDKELTVGELSNALLDANVRKEFKLIAVDDYGNEYNVILVETQSYYEEVVISLKRIEKESK